MKSRPPHRLPGFEDLPPFKFSSEGLERVKKALPGHAHGFIKDLERLIRRYLAGLPGNLGGRLKKWNELEQTALKAARLIGEVRVYPDSYEWIRLMLYDLATDAREQAATFETLAFAGQRGFAKAGAGKLEKKRLERKWLYQALAEFWIRFAGEPLSYAHGEEDHPGPTVQFFRTVLSEVPGEPALTDIAYIKIIDRNRSRLGVGGFSRYPIG
jgi:hypothetical protein